MRKKSDLTAKDIMQRQVVVVYDRDSLQDAMALMTENHVTGLPVVDSMNRCVGVITATDILNYEQEHSDFTAEANSDLAQHFDPDTQQWESVRVTSFALEQFGEIRVEEVMARDLVFVNLDATLSEVAKTMVDQKIHRILVLSQDYHIKGIISAIDFVKLYTQNA